MEMKPIPPTPMAAPVEEGQAPTLATSPEEGLHVAFDSAASTGDPKSMYSLAYQARGTEYERPLQELASTMHKSASEIATAAKPVIDAGGIASPEGRIAASQAWETVADKPQKMRAFIELVSGNKDWLKYITGGDPTTSVVYDRQGNPIEKTVNQLGQIVSVVDSNTGQQLNRQQLAERGGLVSQLADAIGYQNEKKTNEFNTAELNKSNAAVGEYAAAAGMQKDLYSEMQQRLQNLHGAGLSEDQRKAIGTFTSRSMGYAQSISDGLSALAQKTDNKAVKLDAQQQKSLSTVLNALGWKMGADGSITNGKGESVSKGDLAQAQQSLQNGQQFERGFQQSKEDFIRSQVFANLGEDEMKNLGRVLDIQQQLSKKEMELSAKHAGALPFLINPKSYEMGDEFHRGQASALIGEFNADAAKMFSDWRDQQLARYPKGAVPKPGELENAFTRTQAYQDLKAEYASKNKELMRRPAGGTPSRAEPVGATWNTDVGLKPVAPKTPVAATPNAPSAESVPSNYKYLGRDKDTGKKVYQTPEGKRVMEQ